MKPDFKNIDINSTEFIARDTNKLVIKNKVKTDWNTPEQIPVKSIYTKDDLEKMEHLEYSSGIPPF